MWATASIVQAAPRELRLKPGMPFPDMEIPEQRGSKTLQGLLKDKVTILEMWSLGCGICEQHRPELEAFHRAFRNQQFKRASTGDLIGSQMISICLNTNAEESGRWRSRIRQGQRPWINLEIGSVKEMETAFDVFGLPEYFLITSDGIIVKRSNFLDEMLKLVRR